MEIFWIILAAMISIPILYGCIYLVDKFGPKL